MPPSRLPEGTAYHLPEDVRQRQRVLDSLNSLYGAWGYEPVGLPALEPYDPAHPAAKQSFKLVDADNSLLALRSDFTPTLSGLVRQHYRQAAAGAASLRLQYHGQAWHAREADLAHAREFTQVGIELIGVSNARADAELIHLARESVRAVGLTPRIEIGNPALVRAMFDEASIPPSRRDALASAIDRKDAAMLDALLDELKPDAHHRRALTLIPDLYGGNEVLEQTRDSLPFESVLNELKRVEAILDQFEDQSELLLDLGVARRLSYYTGVTFRAYTFDFGQPLLGGGRYDGALLPYAAGFTLGLERLISAGTAAVAAQSTPLVLCSDDAAARLLRNAGLRVLRSLSLDERHLRAEALAHGAAYFVSAEAAQATGPEAGRLAELQAILRGAP